MDHTRRFFRILTEPAAVRFIMRLLAALAALEMLEVFFGCSFSGRLPFLFLLSVSLLAGELSGKPILGLFSCAALVLSVSLLFTWLNSGENADAPKSMLLSGGIFLLIGLLTAEGPRSYSRKGNPLPSTDGNSLPFTEENSLHSADGNGLHSPEDNRLHSPEGNSLHSTEKSSLSSTEETVFHLRGRVGSRILTAALLTGLLCGFLFDRSLSALTTASVLVLVLFEILSFVNPSAQKYFMLLFMFEALCLTFPRSAEPLDWSFAVKAGQGALEQIDYLFEEIRVRFSWVPGDAQSASYSGMGSFAKPKGHEDRVQLKIDRKNTADRTYFAGVHYTIPEDTGWTGRADESLPGEDIINLAAALVRAGKNAADASVFISDGHARIEYGYLHTRDIILPEYTFAVDLKNASLAENSADAFRFKKTQGRGTYYDASWIDVDTGSDSFDRMIRLCESDAQKIPSFEELREVLGGLPGVKASELLSEADYLSWAARNSEGPAPVYLNTDGATERMRSLAESITESCGSDYEKCLAVETFLRQFRYDTKADYSKKENITDAFLFEVQEGWCAHYASAMVLLLRLSGIPARYTEGFLCRYDRREDGFYLVSGSSAHAWPEAWIPGYGWMRFEPTAGYYTRQETSWAREETADAENERSGDDPDSAGSAGGPSGAVLPPPGPDEPLSAEDSSILPGNKVFLRIALTAASLCPLYLALILLLYRLILRIRYKKASLTDRIRLRLEDIFYLIRKLCPGEWKNAPLTDYPKALPDGPDKEELTRLIAEWYRIRYRGDEPDETLCALAESSVMSRKEQFLSAKGPKKAMRYLDLLLRMKSPVGFPGKHTGHIGT